MATPMRQILCQRGPTTYSVLFTQLRSRHRVHKKDSHKLMQRRVFEEVTKPIYPSTYIDKTSCLGKRLDQGDDESNPYEEFLQKQLKLMLESSSTILICQRLPSSDFRLRQIRAGLRLKDMKLSIINNTRMIKLIEGTQLENLSVLLTCRNVMITSPNIVIKDAVAELKKAPELILLGGFLGDRLVTKDQFQALNKLPAIEQLLGQFCGTLNHMAGGKTLSLLNSHQQTLATHLQQYEKQKSEEES